VGAGWVSLTHLVAVPTAFFLAVYLFCTASATRILRGPVRAAAAAACAVTGIILGFSGSALALVAVVLAVAALTGRRSSPGACGLGAVRHLPQPVVRASDCCDSSLVA